ncbi:MAG: GNAT family N-acetyltransferase, partial [Pseudomonadota bacterium]
AEDGPHGLIVLETHPEHMFVYSIAIRPAHQGRGHGQRLLAFAERRAADLGLAEVRLYTNTRMTSNVRLYGKCGFQAIRERPHPSRPGEHLVDMAKPVAPK